MKKAYLIALAIIVILLGFVYVKLFTTQAVFHESIRMEAGAFVLENINNANLKIVTAKTNTITVDLNGPQKDLDKVRFYKKNNGVIGFALSDEWLELAGTITVPEGTFLDVRMSDESNIQINVPEGSQSFESMNSFIIDTDSVNSINISGGDVSIDGWGDVLVIDTEGWDLGDENGGEEGGSSGEEIEHCSIGSQAVRNYCCERFKENESVPECSGDGGWVFNNATRECEYFCESEESEEDEEVPADCSIGSQPTRNQCCDNQNRYADRPDCIGEWRFNNVTRECEFHCYTAEELEEYYGGGGGDMDETSTLCSDFETQEDKDECCDYNLKTPLSLGSKPGFPDCIGRWYFDSEEGCQFDCADYIEMIEILQEIRNGG